MQNKIFTQFSINEKNELLKNNAPTGITISDDYFYVNGVELNLYFEDKRLHQQKPILPFLKWVKISTPLSYYVDETGKIFSTSEHSVDLEKIINDIYPK